MNKKQNIKLLGIAGSLRKDSYNKAMLRTAQEEAPDNMEIEIFELAEIPFFNQDVEAEGDPKPVQKLKQAIRDADAVLIATPEYQHGITGVLKNTLDWASRMPGKSPLNGKIVGIIGASPSPIGTARAQEQLFQVLVYNQCQIVANPQVLVANASKKFENGKLQDEEGRKFIRKHLNAIAEKIQN